MMGGNIYELHLKILWQTMYLTGLPNASREHKAFHCVAYHLN